MRQRDTSLTPGDCGNPEESEDCPHCQYQAALAQRLSEYRGEPNTPDKETDVDMTDPVTLTAVGAVASAGAAAIGKLWSTVLEQHKDLRAALDHCEKEHDKARDRIDFLSEGVASLKQEVGHLRGRMEALQEIEDHRGDGG